MACCQDVNDTIKNTIWQPSSYTILKVSPDRYGAVILPSIRTYSHSWPPPPKAKARQPGYQCHRGRLAKPWRSTIPVRTADQHSSRRATAGNTGKTSRVVAATRGYGHTLTHTCCGHEFRYSFLGFLLVFYCFFVLFMHRHDILPGGLQMRMLDLYTGHDGIIYRKCWNYICFCTIYASPWYGYIQRSRPTSRRHHPGRAPEKNSFTLDVLQK